MSMAPEAFFLPADAGRAGQRFCMLHRCSTPTPRSVIVYVHPFAEELNKTRRMAALQSRAFAAAGHAVLQIDLLGCGDSSGDFVDASWPDWVGDVSQAVRWLQARYPAAPVWIWGLRAGSLLAASAAASLDVEVNLLFWQPTVDGGPLLQQFLRLKAASEMRDGKGKAVIDELRRRLADGSSVEIAGYELSATLAHGLEGATLAPVARAARVVWLEASTRDDAELSRTTLAAVARWQAAGIAVQPRIVRGPAFWQTTEMAEAPALIDASLAAVDGAAEALAA